MTGKWWHVVNMLGIAGLTCGLLGGPGAAQAWSPVTAERLLSAGKDADNWLMYYRTSNVLWIHAHQHPDELTAFSTFYPHNRGVSLYKDTVYCSVPD
jgi:hypothetical protein